jgi:aldose 1-epimerase
MIFQTRSHEVHFPFRAEPSTVWRLESAAAACTIAPEFGCNCYQWQITAAGKQRDLLYADPEVFPGGRPTRSGIPVLFPFPNRLRDGRLTWQGKTFQLPLTDASGKHAIHGFACRLPWRVTPPHREAVCLEPYTCTTDAANLQPRGIDAGWLTLEPGQRWSAVFEMAVAQA